MFKSFTLIGPENLRPLDYGLGCLSFFVVAIGGLAIGLLFAFATALVTKYIVLEEEKWKVEVHQFGEDFGARFHLRPTVYGISDG